MERDLKPAKSKRKRLGTIEPDGKRATPGGLLTLWQCVILTSLKFRDLERREQVGGFPKRCRVNPQPLWRADDVNWWLDDRDLSPAWAGRPQLDSMFAGRFIAEDLLVTQAPMFDGQVLPAGELAEHAVPVSRLAHSTAGIYFLWCRGTIVYVGQTRTGLARILSHIGTKDFESFSFIRCEVDQLDASERAYIDALMPEHNRDWLTRRKRAEKQQTLFD